MPGLFGQTRRAISDGAQKRIGALKPYPTLDMWRNPVTRGFAHRFHTSEAKRALDEIDFEYRMSDDYAGGIEGALYETINAKPGAPFLFYVHGGGFLTGHPKDYAATVLPICHLNGCNGFGPAYSCLPDAAYPTQIDEISAAYYALTESGKRIVLIADALGAAIGLSAMMRWRDEGAPLPVGAVFLSPVIDGMGASDTQRTMDGRDPLLRARRGRYVRSLFRYYAPDAALDDPNVSPIYGDFADLPPMLVHAGGREIFLGDATRLAQAAKKAGIRSELHIYDGMYHRFHSHWALEETKDAHRDIATFIERL